MESGLPPWFAVGPRLQAVPGVVRSSWLFRAQLEPGIRRRKQLPSISLKDGAVPGTHECLWRDRLGRDGSLSNQTFEQLRGERRVLPALTFPVLLKVGFFMAGTLGAGRRGRSGTAPTAGSGLEDSWSLGAMAFRTSPVFSEEAKETLKAKAKLLCNACTSTRAWLRRPDQAVHCTS